MKNRLRAGVVCLSLVAPFAASAAAVTMTSVGTLGSGSTDTSNYFGLGTNLAGAGYSLQISIDPATAPQGYFSPTQSDIYGFNNSVVAAITINGHTDALLGTAGYNDTDFWVNQSFHGNATSLLDAAGYGSNGGHSGTGEMTVVSPNSTGLILPDNTLTQDMT